jgi:hypothetical protein
MASNNPKFIRATVLVHGTNGNHRLIIRDFDLDDVKGVTEFHTKTRWAIPPGIVVTCSTTECFERV